MSKTQKYFKLFKGNHITSFLLLKWWAGWYPMEHRARLAVKVGVVAQNLPVFTSDLVSHHR